MLKTRGAQGSCCIEKSHKRREQLAKSSEGRVDFEIFGEQQGQIQGLVRAHHARVAGVQN